MSADSTGLDLREQIVRIDRMSQETQKLGQETRKLIAEHDKLVAEGRKLDRDRMIAPWQLAVVMLGSVIGGVSGLIAAALAVLHVATGR